LKPAGLLFRSVVSNFLIIVRCIRKKTDTIRSSSHREVSYYHRENVSGLLHKTSPMSYITDHGTVIYSVKLELSEYHCIIACEIEHNMNRLASVLFPVRFVTDVE